ITEAGAAGLPPLLAQLDGVLEKIRSGAIGELKYTREDALPRSATDYFHQNCWVGASFPGPADVAAREVVGRDRWMWGNDYPHDEGTAPFTRQALRQVLHHVPEAELRGLLGGNAARLYGFDLDALAPLAAQHGPTVEEVAQPLDALPENANSALRNAHAQRAAA
nr:amidohydrolase family protein [Micromonospora sp. DSM 115978]